jgi:hypothetical protein
MSIEKIIASIPRLEAVERRTMRVNAERALSDGSEAKRTDARRMIAALDAREAQERTREDARLNAMKTADRIVEAFKIRPMTETERRMIQVLLDNPGLRSMELSEKMNWKAMSWNVHFGEMCGHRDAFLWPGRPRTANPRAMLQSSILADVKDGAFFAFTPEAVEAFARLGLSSRARRRS